MHSGREGWRRCFPQEEWEEPESGLQESGLQESELQESELQEPELEEP